MDKKPPEVVFCSGKGITLRPLDETNLSTMLAWINREDMDMFFLRRRPVTAVLQKKWLEKALSDEGHDVRLGIVTGEENLFIGIVTLHRVDLVNGTAWIGIAIGQEDYRRKGYASEAIRLILNYGFNKLNLRKICWGSISSNGPSIALAKKFGFVEEGRMKDQFRRGDEFLDDVNFGLFRDQWLALKR